MRCLSYHAAASVPVTNEEDGPEVPEEATSAAGVSSTGDLDRGPIRNPGAEPPRANPEDGAAPQRLSTNPSGGARRADPKDQGWPHGVDVNPSAGPVRADPSNQALPQLRNSNARWEAAGLNRRPSAGPPHASANDQSASRGMDNDRNAANVSNNISDGGTTSAAKGEDWSEGEEQEQLKRFPSFTTLRSLGELRVMVEPLLPQFGVPEMTMAISRFRALCDPKSTPRWAEFGSLRH